MGSPQISSQSLITSPTALVRDSVTGDIWAAGYRTTRICSFSFCTRYTAQFARFSATGALIASYEGGKCVGKKMLVGESGPIEVCVTDAFTPDLQVLRLNTEGDQLALTERGI
jgi:hypothetical protein